MGYLDDKTSEARAAGYSWDEINQYLDGKRGEARDAGYSDDEIDKFLGAKDPAPAEAKMWERAKTFGITKENLNEKLVIADAMDLQMRNPAGSGRAGILRELGREPMNPLEAFQEGMRQSSGGLLAFGPAAPEDKYADGWFAHVAEMAGAGLGDLPASAIGAVVGAMTGGGQGQKGTIGAAAGAFALPTFIKQTYADGMKNGEFKGPWDYASRQAVIWGETAKSAVVGASVPLGGEIAGGLATAAGPVVKGAAQTAGEVIAMTTTAKALEGKLPAPEDFVDGAIMVAGFKALTTAGKFSGAVRENLYDHWVKTDEKPLDAAQRASADEGLRQDLQTPAPSEPVAKVETDGLVVPRDEPVDIRAALKASLRDVKIKGMEGSKAPDPQAEAISQLPAETIDKINAFISGNGVTKTAPLAGGAESIVLDAGDRVVRMGRGSLPQIPDIPEVLKPIAEAEIDGARVQVMPKVETAGITEADVTEMKAKLAAKGYRWGDAGADNLGRLPDGSLVVIDGRVRYDRFAIPKEGASFADPGTARSAIGGRIADPTPGPTFLERAKATGGAIYREFFNADAPINRMVDTFTKGRSLEDAKNPKFLRELSRTSGERARYVIENKMVDFAGKVTGPGLNEILKPFEGEAKAAPEAPTFWKYAVAKWAIEKADQAKETGVEVDAARTVVAADGAKYEKAFQGLVAWQNATLKYLADSGVMSQETYAGIVADNAARIPGYRFKEDATPGPKRPGVGRTAYNPVKEFFGSEHKVKDIEESLIRDAFLRVELANRNRENVAIADVAMGLGAAGEGPKSRSLKIELTPEELDKLGAEYLADGEAAIWRHVGREAAKDEVVVFRDGKASVVKFSDPEVVEVLRGYDRQTLSTVAKWAAKLSGVTRDLITLSPDFGVRMKLYDLPQQFIVNPEFRNTFFEFVHGFGHTLLRTQKWDDAVRRGVISGVFDRLTADAYVREVLKGRPDPAFTTGVRNGIESAAKAPLVALKYWASLWHDASQVGRMMAGDKAGETPIRAAAEATQAAFPPPGYGGSHGRLINAVQPFFSAYLNGLETTLRGQMGLGQTIGGKAYNAGAFTLKAAAIITAPVLAQYYLNKDKAWYRAAPEWQKDNGLLFHIGDDGPGEGTTVFLKYPPVLSLLYGAIPRRIAEALDKDAEAGAATKDFGTSFGLSFAPPGGLLSYNVAVPIIEKLANYSFHRGAPLTPDSMSGPDGPLPPERYTSYSTETAKHLSLGLSNLPILKDLNLSPIEIDNFIRGWGGTIAPAALDYAERALGVGKGAESRPAAKWEDLPGFSSFFARTTGASIQPVQDFQSAIDGVTSLHASLSKAMADGDAERFLQLVRENQSAAALLNFSPTGARAIMSAGQLDDHPEMADALYEAGNALDRDKAEAFVEARETVKQLRTLSTLLEAVETPEVRGAIEDITGGTDVKGPLSATDKRQLLDRTYGWLQVVAEKGGTAAKALGLK